MKRLFCVLFVCIFVLSTALLTACRGDNKDDKKYYDDEDGWTPAYSVVIETNI